MKNVVTFLLYFLVIGLHGIAQQPDKPRPANKETSLADSLFNQAEMDFDRVKSPHPEAYANMKKAIELLEEQGASPEKLSWSHYILAQRAFDYMFQADDAAKHLDIAMDYFRQAAEVDTLNLIEMMQFSGYIKIVSDNRNFDEAIAVTEEGLELLKELEAAGVTDDNLKSLLLYNMSLVYGMNFLNNPQKEYQYAVESHKVLMAAESLDIEALILSYRRMAAFEREYSNYEKSKGFINQAWRLYEEHRDAMREKSGFKLELALHRLHLAILIDNREEEEILRSFAKAEQLMRGNSFDEVEKGNFKGILNFMTAYYLEVNPNLKEAKKYSDRAMALHVDSRKAPYSLESFNQTAQTNLIRLLLAQKQYHQALRHISEMESSPGHIPNGLVHSLKARSLLVLGHDQEATEVIHELLTLYSEENRGFNLSESSVMDFTPSYAISDTKTLLHLAEAFRNRYGHLTDEEEKLYWLALVQMQSNIGNTPLNKDLKSHVDQIVAGLIGIAVERPFSDDENKRLLTFMERLSSQELVNTYLLKREIAGSTDLYQLVEEEQSIRSYITYLKKQYQQSKNEQTKQQLFEKELELNKINEKLVSEFRQGKQFHVPEMDLAAFSGQNILQFKVADKALFVTRLFNGKVTHRVIADYPTLKGEIERYLTLINDLETPISLLKEQGAQLYDKLFTADLDPAIPTVIIPDDMLHYLPFDLLVKDSRYLIENHTLSYAPSLYFLHTQGETKREKKGGKVAYFAPQYAGAAPVNQLVVRGAPYSLVGAEAEVNEIARLVPGKKYMGHEASKSHFKSLGGDVSILHLAMHSNLNDDDPELSTLLFSDTEQDYEMYITELYGMNFNGDLAVLSACNTGIGGFKNGGNLVSMHHAFTTAGIPATVASLWNAPDQSTKEIMVSFYKNLQQGMSKAAALQQAKLTYLLNTADENLQHPFYWAGFILTGDDSPIQLVPAPFWQRPWFIILMVLAVIGVVFILVRRNKKNVIEINYKN